MFFTFLYFYENTMLCINLPQICTNLAQIYTNQPQIYKI